MERVEIHTDTIRLDQLLKLAGAVSTGGEVKRLVAEGMVLVNGVTETARRRQLAAGDVLAGGAGEISYKVVRMPAP